ISSLFRIWLHYLVLEVVRVFKKMARIGRGGGIAQMNRNMQDLQRQVVVLATMITQRGNHGGDDTNEEFCEEEETPAPPLAFQERMLQALEGKNDGKRVDVL
ncbi:hypothetical protein KI387_018536, partial [Taxus chinensis]